MILSKIFETENGVQYIPFSQDKKDLKSKKIKNVRTKSGKNIRGKNRNIKQQKKKQKGNRNRSQLKGREKNGKEIGKPNIYTYKHIICLHSTHI